jgi:hypothetical protein
MFRLTRFFSVTSLTAFIIVTVLLGIFYRQAAVDDLVTLGERNNVALTQTFANSLWGEFQPFVLSASDMTGDELREDPETARLRESVLALRNNLSVIKVKVYNLEGLTVFSTEAEQTGQDKSDNGGFLRARTGEIITELTHRDSFSAFEGVIEDRDVISSYVPLRSGGGSGTVAGVIEVYDDVTPLLEHIDQTQRQVIAIVVVVLGVLYIVLFFIVRYGDNVIKRQVTQREEAEVALQRSDSELEAQNRRLARAHEFFRSTLGQMDETMSRGGDPAEMKAYLKQARQQFDRLEQS